MERKDRERKEAEAGARPSEETVALTEKELETISGGSGRVQHAEISVTKLIDKTSQ